jgi:hypothetical protein
MYELLKSFFSQILGYDVTIQKIDENTFVVSGPQLADIPYQGDYVSNLLEAYGLNNVIVYREGNPPSLEIDFSAKWHDQVERASYKFLPVQTQHWQGHDLNRYATLIEKNGLWESRSKLASNLLLLYNLYPKKKLKRASVTLEQGKVSQILTYHEPKSSTVFQRIDGEVELCNLGRFANTVKDLNGPLFDYFDLFANTRETSLEIGPGTIYVNDQILTEDNLRSLKTASNRVASSSGLHSKYVALHRILKEAKKLF